MEAAAELLVYILIITAPLTDEIGEDTFTGIHVNFLQPLRQAVKAWLTAHIIH